MSRFVDRQPIPISLEEAPEDVVYILPKMSYGVQQRVIGAGARVVPGKTAKETTTTLDVGAYSIALLVHNIVRWEGPSFMGIPCTPENIENSDPEDPLFERVLDEIGKRNKSAKADLEEGVASPNSPSSGETNWAELSPGVSVSTTSTSNSRTSGTGRRTPLTN